MRIGVYFVMFPTQFSIIFLGKCRLVALLSVLALVSLVYRWRHEMRKSRTNCSMKYLESKKLSQIQIRTAQYEANSTVLDQRPRSMTSNLVLHCLPMPLSHSCQTSTMFVDQTSTRDCSITLCVENVPASAIWLGLFLVHSKSQTHLI